MQIEEKGGERNNQKSPKQKEYIKNILNRKYVSMEMHKHVTCKGNCIMGSAQSNPINTQSIAHI